MENHLLGAVSGFASSVQPSRAGTLIAAIFLVRRILSPEETSLYAVA
jgi:hypothetical protein